MTYVNDQPKRPAPDVWDDSVAPGGYVCGVCGVPTEDEPCAAHQERGTWWEVAQFRPPPDTRPPVEQTQMPPGSRPVQPRAATPLVERVAEHMYLAVMQATRDEWPLWIHLPAPAQENWRRDAAHALGLRDDSL